MLVISVEKSFNTCCLNVCLNEHFSHNFVLPSNHISLRFHSIFFFFFFSFKGPVEFSMFWRLSLQTYQLLIGSIIIKLKNIWTLCTYGFNLILMYNKWITSYNYWQNLLLSIWFLVNVTFLVALSLLLTYINKWLVSYHAVIIRNKIQLFLLHAL